MMDVEEVEAPRKAGKAGSKWRACFVEETLGNELRAVCPKCKAAGRRNGYVFLS